MECLFVYLATTTTTTMANNYFTTWLSSDVPGCQCKQKDKERQNNKKKKKNRKLFDQRDIAPQDKCP